MSRAPWLGLVVLLAGCTLILGDRPEAARCGKVGDLLRDDFRGPLRAELWRAEPAAPGGVEVTSSGGELGFTATQPGAASGSVSTLTAMDLTDSSVTVKVVGDRLGGPAMILVNEAATSSSLWLGVAETGDMIIVLEDRGVITEGPAMPYDANRHAYWRIREHAGSVFFEASPSETGPWSTLHQGPTPPWARAIQVGLGANFASSAPAGHHVRFSSLNAAAPEPGAARWCAAKSLRAPPFADATTADIVITSNGCAALPLPTGGLLMSSPGGVHCETGVLSTGLYDLRQSEVIAEFRSIDDAAATQTLFLLTDPSGRDWVGLSVLRVDASDMGQLSGVRLSNGNESILFGLPAIRSGRLQFSADETGAIRMATGPLGGELVTRAVLPAPPFDIRAVRIAVSYVSDSPERTSGSELTALNP